MNTYQGSRPQSAQISSIRANLHGQQLHSNPNVASDGFDIWWQKTSAMHTAVVAQASALMRAHRRVSSEFGAKAGQAQ